MEEIRVEQIQAEYDAEMEAANAAATEQLTAEVSQNEVIV